MENVSNVSSEEELLELRNEGKISEDEYQELLGAMRKSSLSELERPQPRAEKFRSKRKLGKIAFALMLMGFILPCVGYGLTTMDLPTQVEVIPKKLESGESAAKAQTPAEVENDIERLKRATKAKEGRMLVAIAPWFFLGVAFEISAFVMGVIAWADVFGKATVITISVFIVLLILFVA